MPDSRHMVLGGSVLYSDSRLFMLDTQNGRIQPLTATTNQESSPAVSPDGRRIAFASGEVDFDVVEIGLDGAPARPLLATSRSEYAPDWSPSGIEYAYVTNANLAWEIWLRSRRDGSARPLVRQDSKLPGMFRFPRFSPDGRRIAYDIYGLNHVIAVSSVAGGAPLVLDQESTEQHVSSWSPDGNWIAYQRLNARKGKYELVKTPLGGGEPVSLGETSRGNYTVWSPSGEWICHPFGRTEYTYGGSTTLRLVSADGRREKILNSPRTAAAGFSRDGSTLYAVRRNASYQWELAIFSVPDWKEKKVTPLDLPVSSDVWGFSLHPSGRSFTTSVGAARYDIWLLAGFPQPSRWRLR